MQEIMDFNALMACLSCFVFSIPCMSTLLFHSSYPIHEAIETLWGGGGGGYICFSVYIICIVSYSCVGGKEVLFFLIWILI